LSITFYTPAPFPANETEREKAVAASGLLTKNEWPAFNSLAATTRYQLRAETALVTVVSGYSVFTLGRDRVPYGAFKRSSSFVGHMIADDVDILIVLDTSDDPRFAGNPQVENGDLGFFAGASIRDKNGFMLGSVCVTSRQPRHSWSIRDQMLLQASGYEAAQVIRRASLIA
jgi:GAF domain-containing protein